MLNGVVEDTKVVDEDDLKRGILPQEEQFEEAIQRSEEPVSRITLNATGGVPIAREP
jgi:hypothetical protein